MKIKLAFALSALVAGCSSEYPIEPQEVVLTYGESTLSAQIQEDGAFEGSNDTDVETVEFSGTVHEQDERYRVEIAVARRVKTSNSLTNMNTTIVLQTAESVVIGGVNSELYSIALGKSSRR